MTQRPWLWISVYRMIEREVKQIKPSALCEPFIWEWWNLRLVLEGANNHPAPRYIDRTCPLLEPFGSVTSLWSSCPSDGRSVIISLPCFYWSTCSNSHPNVLYRKQWRGGEGLPGQVQGWRRQANHLGGRVPAKRSTSQVHWRHRRGGGEILINLRLPFVSYHRILKKQGS